jgi:formylglycine-generating enzyme required for sulfatase activity
MVAWGVAPQVLSAAAAAPTPLISGADAGMLSVPGGTFVMGVDDEGEQDERPAHSVAVAGFWLDETEVTQRAYAECVAAGKCRTPDSLATSRLVFGHPELFRRPDHPVVGVSWFDAKAYCEWRGRRLPTEAEWEHAARGDDGRRFVWGNAPAEPSRFGVFGGRRATEPVGSRPEGRGPYGHLDLAGNVWEWVADEYDPYAYRRATRARGVPGTCPEILATLAELRRRGQNGFTGKNPIPVECERVLRGGAYNYGVNGLRASNRVHHPAHFRIAVAGFRCAKDGNSAPEQSAPNLGQ